MNGTTEHRALLSKSRAARLLGLSVHSVVAMIAEGLLEVRTVPGRKCPRVTLRSIDRYLDIPQSAKTPEQVLREFQTRC